MNAALNIDHILVPHDFGDAAERALSVALGLAEKFGSRLTLLHAYEIPLFGYPAAMAASFEIGFRLAEETLKRIASRARQSNVAVQTALRQGAAWQEIVGAVERLHADLVVMGTQGRRGIHRALIGSVAEKVVRCAQCPVLTVHTVEDHADAAVQRP